MGRPDFEVGVSIEFDEFDRRAEESRLGRAFNYALLGLAMRCRFAAQDDEMRRTPYKRLLRDRPEQPNSMSSGCAPKASTASGGSSV